MVFPSTAFAVSNELAAYQAGQAASPRGGRIFFSHQNTYHLALGMDQPFSLCREQPEAIQRVGRGSAE